MANDKLEDVKEEIPKENGDRSNAEHPCSVEERLKYFAELERWLRGAYTRHAVIAMFPYYAMSSQILNHTPGIASFSTAIPTNIAITTLPDVRRIDVGSDNRGNDDFLRRRGSRQPVGPFRPPGAEGFEYRVPPIWKRFVAEFIDSTMLFVLKLSVTFIAVDFFNFVNLERYDLDLLRTNLRIDYKMALEMTSGILVLELIHRITACIFEAFWLQHGRHGRIGGATPGKTVMGLRVVRCRNITPVERPDGTDVVLVSPGTDLGLPSAAGRAVVKNLILAFSFPICFALFFFRFNRTGYDLVSNSIVVEDPYRTANADRVDR